MTSGQPSLITHWCRNCGTHHPLPSVRQFVPAETSPEGETEVLTCPVCGSYDIDELQEVSHAR